MMRGEKRHTIPGLLAVGTLLLAVWGCAVSNDIPFPVVEARIGDFVVEGQCDATGQNTGAATIDRTARTVDVYVCDTVQLHSIRVDKIDIAAESKNQDYAWTDEVALTPDSAACLSYARFPRKAFSTPPAGADTRLDCSNDVHFTLSTFQDYDWTLRVTQVVNRVVEMDNQVGEAVIDPNTHNVVVYVAKEQSLKAIHVSKFTLGGDHGTVSPDPTAVDTYDFYDVRRFNVTTGWGEEQTWTVMVCHTDQVIGTTASAFARTTAAIVSGNRPNGTEVKVEYRRSADSDWTTVPQEDITLTATTYSADIRKLQPATTYVCRTTAGQSVSQEVTFTTTETAQLDNGSFDNWSVDEKNAKLLYPWAEGASPFWGTGNQGATTVGDSNSTPGTDTSTGSGYSANLASKWIVIKFAAGNIFTGDYLRTDGTNGILGFGRPFTAFPSHLSFDYKFHSEPVSRCNEESLRGMMGQPDSCQIYIALWHVEDDEYEEYNGNKYPIVIRTRPSERRLFSANDKRVIAYAQLTQGDDVTEWTRHTLELQYRRRDLRPTHIQVVASSSKYGDYFTGGPGTLLVLDNMQLLYEE